MIIIEPHIHMLTRTTDDYQAMWRHGIRACVEPCFWPGVNRRYAGSFFDGFNLMLEFETVRARRFGIDHFCAIGLNPKEADDAALAGEVIAGLPPYLDHDRCVALGEIGYNRITANEERAFLEQLALARRRNMLVVIHLPHQDKLRGAQRVAAQVKESGLPPERILVDHNTEETVRLTLDTGCFCGMTVYPISKLDPARVSAMIRTHGVERMIVNGSADWGVSDPLSLVKVAERMRADGHAGAVISRLVFENPMAFYGQEPRWQPNLHIAPQDPREYQR